MEWLDEEFFTLGAFQADTTSGKILLGKGGSISEVSDIGASLGPVFYLKDFFTDRYLQYLPRQTILLSREELLTLALAPCSFVSTGTEDELYEKDFQHLSRAFGIGLEKVVLVSREEFKASHFIAGKKKLFSRALDFGAGIPYGFWTDEYGIVGSTPEILLTLKGKKLSTYALAGTARKGQEEELLSSDKDRHEHQIVVQDIEEKLAAFTNEIETGATSLAGFKNLIHLKTSIEATLSESLNLAALISSLSPTAALGGYPKKKALNFLQETDYQKKYPGRYFGSTMGFVCGEEAQFLVLIRNVQWRGKTFFIESGGGIVAESLLDNELEEINLKRSVIRSHYL